MKENYNLLIINEYTYNLKINGDQNYLLYNVINKIVNTSHLDYDSNTIFFTAEKVISFTNYLSINKYISHLNCLKLIHDLSKQIIGINKLGYSFYGFDIEDIIVIDNFFIICSTKYILPLNKNNIIFISPFEHPYFSNPELLDLNVLPYEISKKCCYYSLGALIVFSLLNKYLLVGNELKTSQEIDKILEPLNNTKIYWFLKRCLDNDINNRKLLLV